MQAIYLEFSEYIDATMGRFRVEGQEFARAPARRCARANWPASIKAAAN